MSLLKKIAGVLLGFILLVVGVGFILPSHVHVEREITINAAPEVVFASIGDLNAWDAWSPWAKLDPEATMTIQGSGVGQTMTWSSENPQVGSGSQAIVSLDAPNYLQTYLDFGDNGTAEAAFTLSDEDGQTRVVWSLDSDMRAGVPLLQQPINTYFGFLMDSMVGKDYEAGLANLKAVVES